LHSRVVLLFPKWCVTCVWLDCHVSIRSFSTHLLLGIPCFCLFVSSFRHLRPSRLPHPLRHHMRTTANL
jgi:hypothetical protein